MLLISSLDTLRHTWADSVEGPGAGDLRDYRYLAPDAGQRSAQGNGSALRGAKRLPLGFTWELGEERRARPVCCLPLTGEVFSHSLAQMTSPQAHLVTKHSEHKEKLREFCSGCLCFTTGLCNRSVTWSVYFGALACTCQSGLETSVCSPTRELSMHVITKNSSRLLICNKQRS